MGVLSLAPGRGPAGLQPAGSGRLGRRLGPSLGPAATAARGRLASVLALVLQHDVAGQPAMRRERESMLSRPGAYLPAAFPAGGRSDRRSTPARVHEPGVLNERREPA